MLDVVVDSRDVCGCMRADTLAAVVAPATGWSSSHHTFSCDAEHCVVTTCRSVAKSWCCLMSSLCMYWIKPVLVVTGLLHVAATPTGVMTCVYLGQRQVGMYYTSTGTGVPTSATV